MSPTIQILPPVTGAAAARETAGRGADPHRGSLGALVRVAGWRSEPTRAPLFSHAGAAGLPSPSLGFLAQHLAQEWSSGANAVDPARAAAAYVGRAGTIATGIAIREAA